MTELDARKLSLEIFQQVAAHVDGAALVRAAARENADGGAIAAATQGGAALAANRKELAKC